MQLSRRAAFIVAVLVAAAPLVASGQDTRIGRCTFKGSRPALGSLNVGNVTIIGDVRQTGTRAGATIWKGDGDVWVIFRNAQDVKKHIFEVGGRVQVCRDF